MYDGELVSVVSWGRKDMETEFFHLKPVNFQLMLDTKTSLLIRHINYDNS